MSSRNRLAGGAINNNTSEDSDRDDQDIAIGIESASDQQPGSLKKVMRQDLTMALDMGGRELGPRIFMKLSSQCSSSIIFISPY